MIPQWAKDVPSGPPIPSAIPGCDEPRGRWQAPLGLAPHHPQEGAVGLIGLRVRGEHVGVSMDVTTGESTKRREEGRLGGEACVQPQDHCVGGSGEADVEYTSASKYNTKTCCKDTGHASGGEHL